MRSGTGAAHTFPVTTTPASEDLVAPPRAPRRWYAEGTFGVLLSWSPDVVDRVYDPATDSWSGFRTSTAAHEHAADLRRVNPGLEVEIMLLEDGVWRDYARRTVDQVIARRWAS